MSDLKSEISGDLARLILGLMMPPAHYDAKQLKKAMEVQLAPEGLVSAGAGGDTGGPQKPRWISHNFLVELLPHSVQTGINTEGDVGSYN